MSIFTKVFLNLEDNNNNTLIDLNKNYSNKEDIH